MLLTLLNEKDKNVFIIFLITYSTYVEICLVIWE